MSKKKITIEAKLAEKRAEAQLLKKKYGEALAVITERNSEIKSLLALKKKFSPSAILPKSSVSSEAVAFIVASDWHIEEVVKPSTVSGLNEFNPRIAKERSDLFFLNSVKLLDNMKRDIEIKTVVLCLLGDFISGNIHEELVEVAAERPTHAILTAQSLLAGGIEHFLKNTEFDFIVVCKVGNHSRITSQSRHGTETGNSLEYLMYHSLAQKFENERRIKFLIEDGYHTYLNVFDRVFRIHHGHGIRYMGGVGGLSIPLNKAIAQWNKGVRADYDIMAHWHTFSDFGNAIVNGSLIGHSSYSIAIKANYEKPKQIFFLLDRKRDKTIVCPIIVENGR